MGSSLPLRLLLLVLAACSAPAARTAQVPTAEPAQDTPAPAKETFLLERQGIALGAERFTRSSERLEGEVSTATGQHARYQAELGPEAIVRRIRVESFDPGANADAAPSRTMTVDFRGDTAVAEIGTGEQTQTRHIRTQPGAIPSLQGSIALPEQMLGSWEGI